MSSDHAATIDDPLTVSEAGTNGVKDESAHLTKVMLENSNGVLWEMDSIRTLFKERRMWPTFIGPKFIQNGTTKITLPVLVWQEQQWYCQEAAQSSSGLSCNVLKRKRTDCSSSNSNICRDAVSGSQSSTATVTPAPNITTASTNKSVTGSQPHYQERQPAHTLNPVQRTRCNVFRDLHDQGYFVGPADAYGGDYSLYKGGGDPSQTHSIATVRVISRGHKITARELLAFSRVQNQVAKSAVLAFSLPEATSSTDRNSSRAISSGADAGTHSNKGGCDQIKATNTVQNHVNSPGTSEQCADTSSNNGVGYLVINFRNVSDRL